MCEARWHVAWPGRSSARVLAGRSSFVYTSLGYFQGFPRPPFFGNVRLTKLVVVFFWQRITIFLVFIAADCCISVNDLESNKSTVTNAEWVSNVNPLHVFSDLDASRYIKFSCTPKSLGQPSVGHPSRSVTLYNFGFGDVAVFCTFSVNFVPASLIILALLKPSHASNFCVLTLSDRFMRGAVNEWALR